MDAPVSIKKSSFELRSCAYINDGVAESAAFILYAADFTGRFPNYYCCQYFDFD